IDIDAYRIDTVLDDGIERPRELALIDVVLILPHPDRLRIDLDEHGQRILQAPRDGDSASQGHIESGQLAGCELRGRVDRRARLGHDDLRQLEIRHAPAEMHAPARGVAAPYLLPTHLSA